MSLVWWHDFLFVPGENTRERRHRQTTYLKTSFKQSNRYQKLISNQILILKVRSADPMNTRVAYFVLRRGPAVTGYVVKPLCLLTNDVRHAWVMSFRIRATSPMTTQLGLWQAILLNIKKAIAAAGDCASTIFKISSFYLIWRKFAFNFCKGITACSIRDSKSRLLLFSAREPDLFILSHVKKY